MMLELQSRLAESIRGSIQTLFDRTIDNISFHYPPRIELGDLALTVAFDLAKTLRRKPREIAEQLAEQLGTLDGVREVTVAGGGYLNLFLDRAAVARELRESLVRGHAASPRSRVIVEHTSINPNKAAHVGHLRNATLGDTFVRVLRHLGHEVVVQNYIDDTGVQVADVAVGFRHLEGSGLPEVQAQAGQERFDFHCWDLYARVGEFYEADPERRKLQAEVLQAIEEGESETAELAALIAARIVECHLATMERIGIRYDLLARESDILRLHFWDRAFELLKESGAIRLESEGKNAGCWVLTMEGEARDEDKIIVRSNRTVTYTGKDIAYQLWKLGLLDREFRYRRHSVSGDGHVVWSTTSGEGEQEAPLPTGASAVYNVIDVGQSYPQRVVQAAVAALSGEKAREGSHHLAYEKVALSAATAQALGFEASPGRSIVKVSGRKGLGVKADDLIDLLTEKARGEIAARGPDRRPEEREATAAAIATGALRYFLLRFGRTKVITFDMDEALAFTGETGPYIQNGVVRARSIFAKMADEGHPVPALLERVASIDLGDLLTGAEGDEVWSLLLLVARSDDVAQQVVRAEEVSLLAKHAFAVAQAFHAYYQKPAHSLLHAENDDRRAFRTAVVDIFIRQMAVLTDLLGIPLPERM